MKRRLDGDDDNGLRLPAVHRKTPLELRIAADARAPVHTEGFIDPRRKEDDGDARIFDQVFEAIQPIVAGAIWNQKRSAVVVDLNKAGFVALGRAVETLQASGRYHQKRRCGNKRAADLVDMVELLAGGPWVRPLVDRCELLERGYVARDRIAALLR